ncbi:MAG TPA: hypothetical protein PJ982_18815, partial [Lacipirellulaceae bacterium]|nr:hypothetical protein [Lacipirellulaceae bacterium]
RNSPHGWKHPVGLKMPNDFGYFDLYGNADEICEDTPGRRYPDKPPGYFVTRGGAAGDLVSPGSGGGNFGAAEGGDLATGFRVCQTVFPQDTRPGASTAGEEP